MKRKRSFFIVLIGISLVLIGVYYSWHKNISDVSVWNETLAKGYGREELPKILNNSKMQIVKVSANPDNGFSWPYYLVIPNGKHQKFNKDYKRYLMIETVNCGITNNLKETEEKALDDILGGGPMCNQIAEQLNVPFIVPVIPRNEISFWDKEEGENYIYTHALDRDTAMMHLRFRNPNYGQELIKSFEALNLEPDDFEHLDRQVIAMADDAVMYLNMYNQNIESDKFFINGYSASGSFADRLATLYPERIKAVATGATLDDMILPLAEYKAEQLIYPIGIADYKEITGKQFNINAYNQVARLIYMGKDEDNDTLPYTDCYGEKEREIITNLFGENILLRAEKLIDLYGQAGGKGVLILDKGIKHSYSDEMVDYIIKFFESNRNSEQPVYPEVEDKKQLEAVYYY